MLKTKKTEILLVIFLLLFISGFFIIQTPSTITKIFLIDSRAIQQNVVLSVTITGSAEEAMDSTTGTVQPTDTMIKQTIPKITGLPINSSIKIRVYTNYTTPEAFTAPSTTQVATVFNYINITLNTTLLGTATIHFNLTQSEIGITDPDDIRLYKYSTSWTELTTTVIDGTSDPASFSAETDSFSPFLIGKKAAGLPSVTTPLGGAPSRGGLKLGLEQPVPRPKPAIIKPGKSLIEKIIKLPAHLIKYQIKYKIIYIIAIALILLVISLEIIYHYLLKKK